MKKKGTIYVKWVTEPFQVFTQEGLFTISPDTVKDWADGYYVAYPSDGSTPYAISKSFIESNYTEIQNDNLSGFKGIGFAAVLSIALIAIGYALIRYVV